MYKSRKAFLIEMAKSLGGFIVPLKNNNEVVLKLSDEQKDFLAIYRTWLGNFNTFIEKQKTSPWSLENNQKLMALSEQAKQWNLYLNELMEDKAFAAVYTDIIKSTSDVIS